MLKFLKYLALILLFAVIGLAIWGYAPDRDIAELRSEYGGAPSQFITLANGQEVHVRDTGPRDAPALLLIHGSGASLHTWEGWADRLEKTYRIIRYDQPGHGLTGPQIDGDYSGKAFSDTAAMVMDHLGVSSYLVAGNSMGGWVAWSHALAYPERVKGLILVDSSGAPAIAPREIPIGFRLASSPLFQPLITSFTPRSIIASTLEGSVADKDMLSDAHIDRYWNLLRYPGNRQAVLDMGKADRKQITAEEIAQIAAPTLILWGSQDTLIPVDAARWFDEHIPDSSLVIYGDLGHLPMEEDAARTANDLDSWLKAKTLDTPPPAITPGASLSISDKARAAVGAANRVQTPSENTSEDSEAANSVEESNIETP
jgi:pimeloyl-ACP methyl ester carboxylesterase